MQSFWIGISMGYLCRHMTLKTLKWPLTSLPIRSAPGILLAGVLFSGLDLFRRAALQQHLLRQQRAQINKQLRQNDQHYDL